MLPHRCGCVCCGQDDTEKIRPWGQRCSALAWATPTHATDRVASATDRDLSQCRGLDAQGQGLHGRDLGEPSSQPAGGPLAGSSHEEREEEKAGVSAYKDTNPIMGPHPHGLA